MDTSLWRPTAEDLWSGRIDGDGPEHARWHQVVRPRVPGAGERGDVALVGFASDAGVRRNHGRAGAAAAPEAIRRALGPLAFDALPRRGAPRSVVDAGTVVVEGEDLEGGQAELGRVVAELLDHHRLVVVLGGGHESAYGSYLGRRAAARCAGARVGVLNLDAHFDLRRAPAPTSGTPFLQMATDDARDGLAFDYTVFGIAAAANTRALFDEAERLGATYRLDRDCQPTDLADVLAATDAICARSDLVHLSIDLDVLPAGVAPGVSAPAAYGVPLQVALAVAERVAASGRLGLVDVVEASPPYDVDHRTARVAARLISSLVEALPPA